MKTLVSLFETSVEKYADNILLWEKTGKEYTGFTYKQIQNEVHQFGAGLMALGIEKGDRIALLAEGRVDWLVAELGMFYAGAINVPLSVKLDAASDIEFRLKHSGAKMIIVSWTQVDKTEAIFDKLNDLNKIIYLDQLKNPADHKLTFTSIKEKGVEFLSNVDNKAKFDALWQNVKKDDLANISYTSGTTADPKGIMLTQFNYAENVRQSNTLMDIDETFKTLTILPWDHSFAHTACLYCFIYNGASIACQQIGKTPLETLKNIPKNINEIKPNMMMSVPAISKAFRKNIESGIRSKGKVAEKLFNQGLTVAYRYNGLGYNRGRGLRVLFKPLYKFYDKIIFSKIRANFGNNIEFFVGGGALLDIELQRFFAAIGMPVMQGYGLSEASPVISSNAMHAYKFGSSGKLVKFMDIKICNEEGVEVPFGHKGEIVIKGGNVMKGYWRNEEATKDAIRNGWLYTSDLGYIDTDGFLFVLGRFKSLLISGDGEKYSPEGIEEAMVDQSPLLDQVMLYNNQNPFTTAMIVPNIAAINRIIESQGLTIGSDEANQASIKILQDEINQYRTNGKHHGMFPERWLPTTFVILPEAFTEQNQLINSTLKMVRGKITEYFADELEFLYKPGANA